MKLDLVAAAQRNAGARTGGVSAVWTGGVIDLDPDRFLELLARAVAIAMGSNIFNGRRPDGSGPMPGRKKDGEPRGKGASIARALAPRRSGPRSFFIAAHLENLGHLARIMGDVPLLNPPLEALQEAVHRAFQAALKLSEATEALRALPRAVRGVAGASARAARAAARGTVSSLRDAYRTSLGGVGLTGATSERSALGKRIRSASRKTRRERTQIGR
jgi:hypothetical protein